MSQPDPAAVFAALGDRTRLALLLRLAAGSALSIAALSTDTGITRQAVTKHLRVLEDVGLVERERSGRESRYGYRPDQVAAMRDYLNGVAAQWDGELARLKSFVEAD